MRGGQSLSLLPHVRDGTDVMKNREARRLNAPRVEDAKAVIAKGAQELAVMRQQSADLFAQITAEQDKAKKIQKDVVSFMALLHPRTRLIRQLAVGNHPNFDEPDARDQATTRTDHPVSCQAENDPQGSRSVGGKGERGS